MSKMTNKKYFLIFLLVGMGLVFKNLDTFALQSGGVEIVAFPTGLEEFQVDVTLTARCLGGLKVWAPSLATVNLNNHLGKPVIIKITNSLPIAQGIRFSMDLAFAGPTPLHVPLKWIVNPGDTKYLGIPISDLTFVTADNKITFDSHTDSKMLGGQIVFASSGGS